MSTIIDNCVCELYHQQWRGQTGKKIDEPTHIFRMDLRVEEDSACALGVTSLFFVDATPWKAMIQGKPWHW